MSSTGQEYYRSDGVRIQHNPYTPEMIEKYGPPGSTDSEGFDPYRDSVGPGIYGGKVVYDNEGNVAVGRQYQGHNPMPGPIYAGGSYTKMIQALSDPIAVSTLLSKYPDLANEITTGGASPLHMCGMSRANQMSTALIIENGGVVDALDTYGYTPLHRMASNNLPVGARALLDAGADGGKGTMRGETPMTIAEASNARDVIEVLKERGY